MWSNQFKGKFETVWKGDDEKSYEQLGHNLPALMSGVMSLVTLSVGDTPLLVTVPVTVMMKKSTI